MNESSLYGISPADLVAGTYELAVQEERDATVYPWNRSYLVGDNPAGVLDRDGTDIPNSALIRTAGRISQSPRKIASWRIARYHGTVIFGGYMIDHYGHFLLESLARLWFAVDNDLPIVWASGVNLQDYQKDILTRLGIDLGRMLFLKKPTRFQSLLIPRPGYVIQDGFHATHARFLSCGDVSEPSDQRIYLSRRAFRSKIANFDGEQQLEDTLSDAGWIILQPEKLTVSQQRQIFASSKCLAGIEGSAFHTAILCKKMHGSIVLVRRPEQNFNYDTIARVKKLRQYNISDHIARSFENRKFLSIVEPKKLAEKIIENSRY